MYRFYKQAYLTYRGLFGWLNWQGYLSSVVFRPILLVITYALLGRFAINHELAQRFAIGLTVSGMMFIIVNGIAQSYLYDRQWGTMTFLFITSVNRLSNYMSRTIFHLPNGFIAFVFGLLAAWLIVDLDFSLLNWGSLIVAVVIAAISITGFGQFIGILVLITMDWFEITELGLSITMALTGMIIPITIFPDAIQEFAKLLPMTNGLIAIRDTFTGASLTTIWPSLLRELLTGFVYLLLGYILFLYFEYRVKRTGALDDQ